MYAGKKDGKKDCHFPDFKSVSDPFFTGSHCGQTSYVQKEAIVSDGYGVLCFKHSNPKRHQRFTSQLLSEVGQGIRHQLMNSVSSLSSGFMMTPKITKLHTMWTCEEYKCHTLKSIIFRPTDPL